MNKDCWGFLGIEPTINQAQIKKAYARLLRQHHPEDDAENFQRLREAYEAALEASRSLKTDTTPQPQASPGEPGPKSGPAATVNEQPDASDARHIQTQASLNTHEDHEQARQQEWEQLTESVITLYGNFEHRLQVQAWQALFHTPAMQRLEVKGKLAVWLFGFFYHHRFISQPVKELLKQTFDWADNYTTLAEAYGENAADSLLDFLEYGRWEINFEQLQVPDSWSTEQIDNYLLQRERLAVAGQKSNHGTFTEALAALMEADITDIALTTWLTSYYLAHKQLQDALVQVEKLQSQAADRLDTHLLAGRIHMCLQNHHAAAEAFRAALQIDEEHVLATKGLANCYLQAGYSYEARELYLQVLELAPFDMEARVQIMQINQATIEKDFSDLKSERYSLDYCCEVAQCYLQNGDYDNCVRFVLEISRLANQNGKPLSQLTRGSIFSNLYRALFKKHGGFTATELPPRLFEYQADACMGRGDHLNALTLYRHAVTLAEQQGENAIDARLKWARTELDHYDDHAAALELATALCEDAPSCAEAWYIKAYSTYLLAREQNASLEDALPAIAQATALDPEHWLYHSCHALILFDLGRYAEALVETDATLREQKYFSWAWYRKAVCLRELGYPEAAVEAFETAIAHVTAAEEAAEALTRLAIEHGWLDKAGEALENYTSNEGDPDTIAELKAAIAECAHRQGAAKDAQAEQA